MDTQYILIQISQNVKNGKLILQCTVHFWVLHDLHTKKHCESIKPESCQTAKTFLILSSSYSPWLFHDGFRTKQRHFTLSSVQAHRFFTTSKSYEVAHTGQVGFTETTETENRNRNTENTVKVTCIFNKLQQWASIIVIYDFLLLSMFQRRLEFLFLLKRTALLIFSMICT